MRVGKIEQLTTVPGISRIRREGGSYFVDLHFAPMDEVRKQVAERLASDTEGKVKQALIDLGWTPPTGTK